MKNDLIANRYKPLFLRARGGFSDVEIAWDTRLTRRVALKRIYTGKTLRAGSLDEARTVALLACPHIVSIYDSEQTGTETLIVMENVDGPSLAELMASSTELLDKDTATTILEGIVQALEYAHENQVLHLDIKPANVLIDQSGNIKVSDFGLAELAGSNGFGEVQGGTIGYMPPEQLVGSLVDARTDVWALAALSYQLLTGVNPFFALSPRESLQRITELPYNLPSTLRPELSGALDEALIKALSPQIDARPLSVAAFWAELRPHLGRINPGRRKLKALAHAWAGQEATLLEGEGAVGGAHLHTGTLTSDAYDDEERAGELEDSVVGDEATQPLTRSYEEEDASWSERDLERRAERARRRAERRAYRKNRDPLPPLWQRLSPLAQATCSRIICALGAAAMAWLAMSALPYLSDPLAQAATAAAANTGNPAPALLDAAFAVRLALTALVAVVTLAAPTIGSALAALCLVLGIFFTGNWLVGMLLLIGSAGWWVAIGRKSPADSAVFTLAPLASMLTLPLLTPLFAGYFLSWGRALGTTAFGCFTCSLLSVITTGPQDTVAVAHFSMGEGLYYGNLSALPPLDLLGASDTLMQMPSTNELFIPLISLFTSPEFWLIAATWAGASVVMSLLLSGKSRVKYVLVTLCGVGIIAVGHLSTALAFAGTDHWMLLASLLIRLVGALGICLLVIVLGVRPKPFAGLTNGRVA